MGNFYEVLKRWEEERRREGDPVPQRREEVTPQLLGPGAVDSRLVAYLDKSSPEMEQFRMLRTNLLALAPEAPPRLVGFTSSIKKEGKSLTCLNVAATFAEQRDVRVLVVDADLRRPSLTQLVGLDCRYGLSQLLTRNLPLRRAVYETPVPQLWILPAGDPADNPAELLGSRQMKDLLEVLRTEYDFVFFDSPPILVVHDAGLLGRFLDGLLYIVKLQETPRERVQEGLEVLERARVRVLGLVLTNAAPRGRSRGARAEYYAYRGR